jgi:cell pole-organizing protein PopZ
VTERPPFPAKGQVYVDSKVGDILATIRKSVDDDMDSLALPSTASQSRGTLMRGVLREMRVTMTTEPSASPSVREEIETLRDRIKRKGEAVSLLGAPILSVPERVTPPSFKDVDGPGLRGEFSGILSGRVPNRAAPVLRPSLVEEDHFSGDYDEPQSPVHSPVQSRGWVEEEPEYPDPYQEQAYDPAPHQHYHDRGNQGYPMVAQQPMLSADAEAATETAFRHLSESLLARATGDRGLEDMTREMLRGMIKQWLDANLPTLVEELVREEIERVARKGR